MKVRYSPLPQQFAAPEAIFEELRHLVASGDFTLGKPVGEFERQFAETVGTRHAIGVGSGTDALKLPMKAIGVGHGDEVIATANTFIATVGAINELGARTVFVDCDDSFCIDVAKLEAAITPRTKAIMAVHLTGGVADMGPLMEISARRGIPVIEDACQSLMGERGGKRVGTWGIAAGFSMHPLKIINVWGDAGVIVTDDDEMARQLRMLRNHGLRNRDEIEILGFNTRLDSVQAVVGKWILAQVRDITARRIANADRYDAGFAGLRQVRIPPRGESVRHVFLLYILFVEDRDRLLRFCLERGIEAKVHYPIPLYHQDGLKHLGYKPGDFPVTDRHAGEMITFPVDQHLSDAELDYVIATVREFYGA